MGWRDSSCVVYMWQGLCFVGWGTGTPQSSLQWCFSVTLIRCSMNMQLWINLVRIHLSMTCIWSAECFTCGKCKPCADHHKCRSLYLLYYGRLFLVTSTITSNWFENFPFFFFPFNTCIVLCLNNLQLTANSLALSLQPAIPYFMTLSSGVFCWFAEGNESTDHYCRIKNSF